MGFGVWGLGFGVWGLGFRVWGLGFGACRLTLRWVFRVLLATRLGVQGLVAQEPCFDKGTLFGVGHLEPKNGYHWAIKRDAAWKVHGFRV